MEASKILNEKSTPAIPAEPPSLASTGPQYSTIQSLVEAQEERRRGLQHKPHYVLQEQVQPCDQSAGTGSRIPASRRRQQSTRGQSRSMMTVEQAQPRDQQTGTASRRRSRSRRGLQGTRAQSDSVTAEGTLPISRGGTRAASRRGRGRGRRRT